MYNPPALPQPVIPALDLDLYLSPPLPPSSPPRMAPYIIELSSDESEPLPPPPSKRRRHTTSASSPSISKTSTPPLHPSSPMPPKTQKSITSFFSPPGIKSEQIALPQFFAQQRTRYLEPVPTPILFKEGDMVVDADEAPIPEPFDAPSSPIQIGNGDDDEWERFTPLPEGVEPKQKSPRPAKKSNPPTEKRKFQDVQSSPEKAAGDVKRRLTFAAVPSVYGNSSVKPADSAVSRFRAVKTVSRAAEPVVASSAGIEANNSVEAKEPIVICMSPPGSLAAVNRNGDPMDIDTHNTTPAAPTLSRSRYSTANDVSQSTPIARQTFGMPYSERAAYVASLSGARTATPMQALAPLSGRAELPRTQGLSMQAPNPQFAALGGTNILPQAATPLIAPARVEDRPLNLSLAPDVTHQDNLPANSPLNPDAIYEDNRQVNPSLDPVQVHVDDHPANPSLNTNIVHEDNRPANLPLDPVTVHEGDHPVISSLDAMHEDGHPVNPSLNTDAVHGDDLLANSSLDPDVMCEGDRPADPSSDPNEDDHPTNPSLEDPDAMQEDGHPANPPPDPDVMQDNYPTDPSLDPDAIYEDDDFPPENPFRALTKGPTKINDLGKVVCALHRDSECESEECAHEFFEKYCPMEDTKIGDLVYPDYIHVKRRNQIIDEEEVLYTPFNKKELIAVLIASGELGNHTRLPYLTLEARKFLRNNTELILKDLKKVDGDLLHVQFTVREVMRLGPAVRSYAQRNKIRLPNFSASPSSDQIVRDLYSLLTYTFSNDNDTKALINRFLKTTKFSLPGRQPGDIQRFIWDAYNNVPDLNSASIMVAISKPPLIRGIQSLRRELGIRDFDPLLSMQARHNYVMANLRPVWKFNGGSSDIHDAQWTPSGERFAMSTPCTSDQYNRPGNLMFGYATTQPPSVRMLYRHALKVRPTGGTFEKYEYTSVPSIRFSNNGKMLHSCGLDGCVKTWSAQNGKWLGEVGFDDQVLIMEISPVVDGLLAAGRSKGVVSVVRINEYGTHDSVTMLNIFDRGNKNKIYPAAMAWGRAGFENILVTGYDNEGNNKSGGLAIWDVEREMNIFKIKGHVKYPQRHFDVYMGERGRFVTGSLRSGRVNTASSSVVRLWDLNTMSDAIECFSDQADLNCVTISPCERYLTSSGTTNNTLVWDIRNTQQVLHNLQHGPTTMPTSDKTNLAEDDTGVTFIKWSPYNSSVFTGGSDGKVKQWDVTRADPFILDIASVESQIMTAAFNPSWDSLIVGEASGRATLFSAAGDEDVVIPEIVTDWNEDRSLINPDDDNMRWSSWNGQRSGAAVTAPADDENEQSDSGVLLSREMISDGLIQNDPLNPRYVWATDKYKEQKEQERKRKEKVDREKQRRGGRT